MVQNIAFIGFGGVGQALAEILHNEKAGLKQQDGLETKVVAVSDVYKGAVYHPNGLDIPELLKSVRENGTVEAYPNSEGLIKGWDSLKTIKESNADTIVEVTFTDVNTGQPAINHCRAAFQLGKNVVTTNKGPVALAYPELQELADQNNAFWGFEGTVMSGTPALRMPKTSLAGNKITEIKGILNGTTNYILTQMADGMAYDEALEKAQSYGYAEADPTSDVEGYDARYKAVILAQTVMGASLDVEDVRCHGITEMSSVDMNQAKQQGKHWKLLARIKNENGKVVASVQPELLEEADPLATVPGAVNAITYECDLAGPITLMGAGAGLKETGFSLLIDLINMQRQSKVKQSI